MKHTLDRSVTISCWDRDAEPRLHVAPGDELAMATHDASGGQVHPGMTAEAYAQIERERIHALTGPVCINGAEPGDALIIELQSIEHEGWAWTSIVPELGLLPDDFDQPFLFHWELEGMRTRSFPGVVLDLHPFLGIIGVQRAEQGRFRTRAPGTFGGNMDVRHLVAGTRLVLPVATPGAGLCVGDAHAAQGDGEVSINGMEAPMQVQLRVDVEKGRAPAAPTARVPGELLPPRYLEKPFEVFIASHEDPREAARDCVRRAIDYLVDRLQVRPEEAYILCSVVLDLKLSQLVNTPMTTVAGYLPEAIFST